MSEPIRDVLFLVADQWRGDTMGMLGTPGVRTPHLDALAGESVVFTNHWCQVSPCGPSRNSLLTGTHAPTHGQWTNGQIANHGLDTLAACAGAAGVAPLLVGYTDTPQEPRPGAPDGDALYDPAFEVVRPFFWQIGFPEYRAVLEERGYGPLAPGRGGLWPPASPPGDGGPAPTRILAEDSDAAWLTDAAEDVLRGRHEPLLLHVNWLRPHPPLIAPEPYHRLVHPDEVALPAHRLALDDQFAAHPFFELSGPKRLMAEYLGEERSIDSVHEGDERQIRATYYGLCAEVDHQVGRLLEALRESGRDSSTLVVFLSDHGDSLGDHWLYGRQGPFDGHFRVPCIVRDPRPEADCTRGTTVDEFTANIDAMPTILDALRIAIPSTVEGESLLPFLHGSRPSGWRTHVRYDMDWTDSIPSASRGVAGASTLRFAVIRTGRYRYVEFNSLEPMLFDTLEDPDEVVNRASDPTMLDVRRELANLLVI